MDKLRYGAAADSIFVLILAASLGVLLTAYRYVPEATPWLPTWAAVAWAAILTVSSVMALIGTLWRGLEIDGWSWELAGRPGVAGTCIAYAWGSAMNIHDGGDFLGVVLFGGIAIASGFRAYGIFHRVLKFRAAIRAQENAGGRL